MAIGHQQDEILRSGTARSASGAGEPRLRRWLQRWRPAAPLLMLFAIGVGAVIGHTNIGGVGHDREGAQDTQKEK